MADHPRRKPNPGKRKVPSGYTPRHDHPWRGYALGIRRSTERPADKPKRIRGTRKPKPDREPHVIFTEKYTITGDTKTNKLIILNGDGKRIVITPVTRTGTDAHIIVDDRPVGQPMYVKELLQFLVQNLYTGRKAAKSILTKLAEQKDGARV